MSRGRLSHDVKYFGTFTNSKKETRDAYFLWDEDNADQGFMIRDRNTNKLIRNDRFPTLAAVREAGFTPDGQSEPVAELAATVA